MTETPRVAHLISHPIQYYAPLYRELAMRGNIDLTVFFRSDQGLVGRVDPGFGTAVAWDIPLLEGYRSRFLCGSSNQRSAVRSVRRALILWPIWHMAATMCSGSMATAIWSTRLLSLQRKC